MSTVSFCLWVGKHKTGGGVVDISYFLYAESTGQRDLELVKSHPAKASGHSVITNTHRALAETLDII